MRSWSVMAMTSRSVCRSTWSRIASIPAVPSLRQRVDVQVGATEPLVDGHAAAPGGRTVPSAGAPPAVAASRSGQIGKKTAHHWSGASAMSVSKAAASRVIVVVTRSRRVPSAGTSIGMSLPRKWPAAGAPDGHRVGRDAALDGQHRRPHRHRRRGPEQRDRDAAAGQVAIADEADRDAVLEAPG